MRGVVGMLAVLLASVALAAPKPAPVAMPEDAGPKSDLPLFGGDQKTPQQEVGQIHFIDTAIKAAGSRQAAAQQLLTRGWADVQVHDLRSAIVHFNGAWLLTPDNGEVYWGLGTASAAQGQYPNALQLFAEAKKLLPENPRLLADYGRVYYSRAAVQDSLMLRSADLNAALGLINRALALAPNEPGIYMELALVKYYQGQYAAAWQALEKQRALDPASVDLQFERSLGQKMPRPENK